MVKCKLCSNDFKIVSSTHLASAHQTKIRDYTAKFGHAGVGFSINVLKLPTSDPRYIKWRKSLENRKTGWAKGYTKETHPSLAKMSETLKRNGIDNFAEWRDGQRKMGLIPSTDRAFAKDRDLAFLIGLTLGDGNIHPFPRTECLRIALASKYPGLINHTGKVIYRVFQKKPSIRKVKNSACYTVTIYQNNISNRLGIPTRDRSKLNFILPPWISRKKDFLLGFLRGLFEAEGSLSVHLPTCTYNFQFSNKNKSLLKITEKSLKLLGYHPEARPIAVRLRRRVEVESFRKLIQFRIY